MATPCAVDPRIDVTGSALTKVDVAVDRNEPGSCEQVPALFRLRLELQEPVPASRIAATLVD